MEISHLIETYVILCLILILWSHIIYPAFVIIISKEINNPVKVNRDYSPNISICISAYNEEDYIERCVRSIYNSDYDLAKVKVIVGLDGSTDRTKEILSELQREYNNLYFVDFRRSGKNFVLNEISRFAEGEIIFYMDADCELKKNAISEAVKYFADEKVGAVFCKIISQKDKINEVNSIGDKSYTNYEDFIRKAESSIYATSSSLGLFLGIRKELYVPLPNDLVLDDSFMIFMVGLKGKRVIFAEDVLARELRERTLKNELSRRIRMTSASLPTLFALKKFFSLKPKWFIFSLFSHRILRWFSGIFFFSLLLIFLVPNSIFYYPLVICLSIFYLFAFLGLIFEFLTIKIVVFSIPAYFLLANIGLTLGIFKAFFKKASSKWEK